MYSAISYRKSGFPGSISKFLIIILVVLLAGGLFAYFRNSSTDIHKATEHPEYLSFAGSYVFSIPANSIIDERAITGMQLVYTGELSADTLEEIYEANGITVQPLTFLKDHKSSTFKKYVNETFVPDLKKNVAPDVQVTFGKSDGWDMAQITVKKNGAPLRFIYLKNGQHPVSIVSKEESEPFKKVEQSITDVEKTDLKNENVSLRQTTLNIAKLIKDQNARELYSGASTELRAKSSEDKLAEALKTAKDYSQGNITIDGGKYNGGEFAVVVNFTPLNKDIKPASGAIYLIKSDGKWKLKALQLPTPPKEQ